MLKEIDLANKCGSCDHFRKIDGTAQGECLKNPYGENVVHDPKHPYWIVSRSRAKCRWYNAPPPTNADRIRAMSDRELADFLSGKFSEVCCSEHSLSVIQLEALKHNLFCIFMKWLKQPAE